MPVKSYPFPSLMLEDRNTADTVGFHFHFFLNPFQMTDLMTEWSFALNKRATTQPRHAHRATDNQTRCRPQLLRADKHVISYFESGLFGWRRATLQLLIWDQCAAHCLLCTFEAGSLSVGSGELWSSMLWPDLAFVTSEPTVVTRSFILFLHKAAY